MFHNNVNDTDTTLAVKELEDRILNDLARQFLKCQSESGRMRMLQTNVNDTMLASESESESESDVDISDDRNSTGIVQLESRPVDLPDADLVFCTEATDLGTQAFCIPYHGAMTAYSSCDTCSAQEISMLLSAIQKGCDNDAYIDFDAATIQKVHFVGVRALDVPNIITNNQEIELVDPSEPPINVMGGFFIFFIIASVVAVLTVAQMYRKRKNKEKLDQGGMNDDDDSDGDDDDHESFVNDDDEMEKDMRDIA